MSNKILRDWLDDPEAPTPPWEWPTAARPPLPVIGETELFVNEESAAQVANVFSATDVDAVNRGKDIKSRGPTVDPDVKWQGTDSSDS